jgi:hypothetical protein
MGVSGLHLLEVLDLHLLPDNLRLLLFDGVDEDDAQTLVLDTFGFAFAVCQSQGRRNLCDIFGPQADVFRSALFPVEANGSEPPHNVQPSEERMHIGLESQTRRTALQQVTCLIEADCGGGSLRC